PGVGLDVAVGEVALGVLGVISAGEGALPGLRHRRGDRLPHLLGHETAELFGAGVEDIGEASDPLDALGEGGPAVGAEGTLGAGDPVVDLGVGQGLEALDELARGRVDTGYRHIVIRWFGGLARVAMAAPGRLRDKVSSGGGAVQRRRRSGRAQRCGRSLPGESRPGTLVVFAPRPLPVTGEVTPR